MHPEVENVPLLADMAVTHGFPGVASKNHQASRTALETYRLAV